MTEIQTIDGSKKDALLKRANIQNKRNYVTTIFSLLPAYKNRKKKKQDRFVAAQPVSKKTIGERDLNVMEGATEKEAKMVLF